MRGWARAGAWLARRTTRRRADAIRPRLVGGLALARNKPGLERPILDVPLPPVLVLPLVGHGGRSLDPCVSPGRRVARGETLAPGVLASADATVVAIEPRPIAHPAGRHAPCLVLETDAIGGTRTAPSSVGEHALTVPEPIRPTLPALDALTFERLVACGVTGLGGAGFPTPEKLRDAVRGTNAIGDGTPDAGRRAGRGPARTLVLNGAECEPGIACDEALMAVAADEIVAGGVALARLVGAARCLVVVESDKGRARAAIREAVDARTPGADDPALRLVDVAPLYPSGAERLLIRLATGIDVPSGERPLAHGVLCVNVATARAAHRARLGEPLLARIVTVAGARTDAPRNVRVAFGTPFFHVLDTLGQAVRAPDTRCRAGGPLSGFDVATDTVPVTPTVNRIALEPPLPRSPASPCIRCAACSDVCPVGLLPQELLRHVEADLAATGGMPGATRGDSVHRRALDRGGLDACLECGCCDLVCPSSIPLTATFRHARGARADAREHERAAARAEALHRRRTARRDASRAGSVAVLSSGSSVATDGVDRAAARTVSETHDPMTARPTDDIPMDGVPAAGAPPGASAAGDPVAAALERARARRQRRAGGGADA